MLYVLTYHNQVLLGPVPWDHAYMSKIIELDLELEQRPLILPSDYTKVPFDVMDYVRIRKAKEVRPFFNPKTQKLTGPSWSFDESEGTATYSVQDKTVAELHMYVKEELSKLRWTREVSGFDYTAGENTFFVSTDRDKRNIFNEKIILSQSQNVQWKVGDKWIELTNQNVIDIVGSISKHVQDSFDWEAEKMNECNGFSTVEQFISFIEENGL